MSAPLLLVHGIGDTHRTWRDVVPRLEGDFECHAIDLPGFGGAAPLPGPPTMAALATACREHMRERGHRRRPVERRRGSEPRQVHRHAFEVLLESRDDVPPGPVGVPDPVDEHQRRAWHRR